LRDIVTPPVSAVKGSEPPPHLADVIARLRAIEASAPRSDGVVCFARLYREVTEGVAAELTGEGVADARFVKTLDVQFAGLFFSALESYGHERAKTPSAWVPLFDRRSRRGIAPLQFALAGMNAHINRDLPVALVATCRELGLDLGESSPEHADFERVDALLAQVETRVKRSYLTGWVAWVDRIVHRFRRIDDVVDERTGAVGAGRRAAPGRRLPARARPDGRTRESRAPHSRRLVAARAPPVT